MKLTCLCSTRHNHWHFCEKWAGSPQPKMSVILKAVIYFLNIPILQQGKMRNVRTKTKAFILSADGQLGFFVMRICITAQPFVIYIWPLKQKNYNTWIPIVLLYYTLSFLKKTEHQMHYTRLVPSISFYQRVTTLHVSKAPLPQGRVL